jgi:hypothetical protein
MAVGNVLLSIAFLDLLIRELRGERPVQRDDVEPAHVE